jgi:hypothetical protein
MKIHCTTLHKIFIPSQPDGEPVFQKGNPESDRNNIRVINYFLDTL